MEEKISMLLGQHDENYRNFSSPPRYNEQLDVNNKSHEHDPNFSISKKETGRFERIEDKFLIPIKYFDEFKDFLERHMEYSYWKEDTMFTQIESLYFDSKDLLFFRNHFLGLECRQKLRVRKYAPNGNWDHDHLLLELKNKKNGITEKIRFFIDHDDFEILLKSSPLTFSEKLRECNPHLKKRVLKEGLSHINDLMITHSLVPINYITYLRLAFEKDNFRVTLDQKIFDHIVREYNVELSNFIHSLESWERMDSLHQKFEMNEYFVMEIKHQNNIPLWMLKFIDEKYLEKSSFSKYCWFTTKHIKESLSVSGCVSGSSQ